MSFTVTLDPPAVAVGRTELNINTGPIQVDQKGIDWGDAAISAYMANEQRWGQSVVGYRVPNRTVSIPLFLSEDPGGTFDNAYDALRQKVARFQAEGGVIKRDSGRGPVYLDIQSATLHFPDQWAESNVAPDVTLTLECIPDFYGNSISLDLMSGSGEIAAVLTQGGSNAIIAGDYPARCTIACQDTSGHDQYGLMWAFRSRYYNNGFNNSVVLSANNVGGLHTQGDAIPPLVNDSTAPPPGPFGTPSAITCSAPNGVWTDIAYWAKEPLGSYQVWARASSDAGSEQLRLKWGVGDANTIMAPVINRQVTVPTAYTLLNLGQIRLPRDWTGTPVLALIPQAESGGVAISAIYLQHLDDASGRIVGLHNSLAASPAILANQYLRADTMGAVRTNSVGEGSAVQTFGDMPRLPVSGFEGRPVEGFFKPSRGDFGVNPAFNAADPARDSFTVQVSYRPSYLFRP